MGAQMLTESQVGALLASPGKPPLEWSDEQIAAITAPAQPHLVVAGAGSGKTTVMAARVLWLVGNGEVNPERILGLTFTNKAASEFSQRCMRGLERLRAFNAPVVQPPIPPDGDDGLPGEPSILTYHSFAQRLLAEHGLRIGYEPGSTLMHEVTRRQLAFRVVQRTRTLLKHVSPNAATVASRLLSLDDLLAERLIEPERLIAHDQALVVWLESLAAAGTLQRAGEGMLATAHQRMELAGLVQELLAAKRERFMVDFADQMNAAARLAQHIAERQPELKAQLREQYQVVLLDEYQDTSVAQRLMLQALFGDDHPVMAVGDPCQAIYGWRGASVFNMDAFTSDFTGVGGRKGTHSPLTRVRRCAPEILEVANRVSEPVRAKHPLVQPLQPDPNSSKRGSFTLSRHETQADETRWVAQQVRTLTSVHPAHEVAVLCRVTADLGRVAAALDVEGIPYDVVGVTALLSRPEVADVIAMLRLIDNPGHNASLVRVLAGARWSIGVRDFAAIGRRARAMSPREKLDSDTPVDALLAAHVREQDPADVTALSDVLEEIAQGQKVPDLSDVAAQRCRELVLEIRTLRRHVGEPVSELIRRIVHVTGVDVQMRLGDEQLVATRVRAMETLMDIADDFVGIDGSSSLHDFLKWLDDATRFEKVPSVDVQPTGRFVRLMTVHASKGLEFDAVVLPYLVDGVFPSSRGRPRWPSSAIALPPDLLEDRERAEVCPQYPDRTAGPRAKDKDAYGIHMGGLDLLEETRLAYVAITRARFQVVASAHVWGPTQVNARALSPWLKTMWEYVHDGGAGTIDCWVEDPDKGVSRPDIVRSSFAWPPKLDDETLRALEQGAERVRQAQRQLRESAETSGDSAPATDAVDVRSLDSETAAWTRDVETLISQWRERAARVRDVLAPSGMSASDAMRLLSDPEGYTLHLARPMPRVTNQYATRGTQFHAYVEHKWRGELALFSRADVDDISDEPHDDSQLQELISAFEAGPFAHRPPTDVEVEFTAVFGSVTVRGRIDAVFLCDDGTWEIIDWKTNARQDADPVQLAIYRYAWAQLRGVPADRVSAGFHYVRSGTTDMHSDSLPSYEELCELLSTTSS
ncbi:MAG: ATP-dependent helicase [Actinobacteria bacterium]|nr:ATP-dependent helicase [Actinomycetota bacterium]